MLRAATKADLDFVQRLLNKPENLDRLAGYSDSQLIAAMSDPTGRLWIWQEDLQPLGFALVSGIEPGKQAKLEEFAVTSPGGGRGALLLEAVCASLLKDDIRRLCLHVAPDNKGAIRFYERSGFEYAPAPDILWQRRAGDPVRPLRMERDL